MEFAEFYQKGLTMLLAMYKQEQQTEVKRFYKNHKDWVKESYDEALWYQKNIKQDGDVFQRKLDALVTSLDFAH